MKIRNESMKEIAIVSLNLSLTIFNVNSLNFLIKGQEVA